jgi:phenol hydroxylase P0 protein
MAPDIERKTPAAEAGFDANRKYVRVCEQRANGLVEFEFAIGEPTLCVELMLPTSAFHEFCLANNVILLEARAAGSGDWVARMNEASHQEYQDYQDKV